ncbi:MULTISPECIES: histidine phosphatase family protein [unclassified Pseudomonas]|uniref:lipopolysaccharide core heptose(II)-phosphate phosphatase PmrG n=1 Tax=unclassified Pseudomonas TaxID=196821 RepID=UPI002B2297F4|nr:MULTISPECIES: histidine phosphatase family protein [unclassified Pseudomonas]MEA9980018.1 histidine phosphatase family protein [Pseudomonas sp. RTS4]MEB0198219.1 histidine phosphatase family protein [Pseudomonas sp. 5S4]MEB0247792.1 histidine phosphatase family protein [Pseudomonas sp. 10S5]
MKSRLNTPLKNRSDNITVIAKYKYILMVVVAGLIIIATYFLMKGAPLINLGQANAMQVADLKSQWANGEVIALVRHVERCDHSKAPCLDKADGITSRGRDAAIELGKEFQKLGIEKTDIYSSPLTRTAQSALFMFGHASAEQNWLINCKNTMLHDVLQQKMKGRNLILVTHSECMVQLEKSMKLSTSTTLDYGISIFISKSEAGGAPLALGFIDAQSWQSVFPN